ncbi:MAG TPA: NAD(P)H-hydrate dehydratase [Flavobacterium sp.]|jgi:hydroxyethylthiazole kinase-like uncharacterized protein yjeF
MVKPEKIGISDIRSRLKVIDPKSHKGTFGHTLIIGGSHGKIGAVCLASKAALKTGCGLVTAYVPECGYQILQTSIPEVMVLTDTARNHLSEIKFDIAPQAIGIGPGMGQEQATQKAFHEFLKSEHVPLVVDADALNILAKNPSWLKLLPPKTILTPHEKELERLIGTWNDDEEKILKAYSFSRRHNVMIVVKGAPTIVIADGQIIENTTGNAALATAGSGDVLTGIITSLVAQGYDQMNAAIIGVYIHGLTADLAISETSIHSFIASDIINFIGKAYLSVEEP